MTDDEADRYYDQWLTAKAQNKRLRAENARLREALEEYACNCEAGTCAATEGFRDWPCGGPARTALKEAP